MTPSPAALVRVATGQDGYREQGGPDGKSGNLTLFGKAFGLDGYAWCSIFVWWCFFQLGIDVRHVVSASYASADAAMHGFAAKGWEVAAAHAHRPVAGDVVFFHFSGEHAGANHTGIVVAADSGGVHTEEGNTSKPGAKGSQVNGGGVYARYRPYSVIIGYGRYPWPKAVAAKVATAARKPLPAAPLTLQRGMGSKDPHDPVGHKVRRLQALLHQPQTGLYVDVEPAVHRWQHAHHLIADGVAGPATLRAIGF